MSKLTQTLKKTWLCEELWSSKVAMYDISQCLMSCAELTKPSFDQPNVFLYPVFIYNYFSLTFSCESVVTLTKNLYHVNQHNITHIMQKKFFFKNRFLGKNFFFDLIPHLGRITSDTNMEISSKCFFLVVLIKSS